MIDSAKSDREKQRAAEILAWSTLVKCIARTAKRKAGARQWQLECAFKIGTTASGSVWRSWERGERLPYRATQLAIIREAIRRSWLEPSPQEMDKLRTLLFEEIYSLPAAPVLIDEVPDPPGVEESQKGRPSSARKAAEMLIRDAETSIHKARTGVRPPSFLRRDEDIQQRTIYQVLKREYDVQLPIVERWRFATNKVRELLKESDEKVIEVALIAAYKKRGYR